MSPNDEPKPRLEDSPVHNASADWSIRLAIASDLPKIHQLRSAGVMLADDRDVGIDACLDISCEDEHAHACLTWIAESAEGICGLISLVRQDPSVARFVELYVDLTLRHSHLPAELVASALRFSRETGILKLVLGTYLTQDEVVPIFEHCGYRFTKRPRQEDHKVVEFYLDLYQAPGCERPKN